MNSNFKRLHRWVNRAMLLLVVIGGILVLKPKTEVRPPDDARQETSAARKDLPKDAEAPRQDQPASTKSEDPRAPVSATTTTKSSEVASTKSPPPDSPFLTHEFRDALRVSFGGNLLVRFRSFFEALNLSALEHEQLESLLVAQLGGSGLRSSLEWSAPGGPKSIERQLEELLGAVNYTRLQNYVRQMPVHNLVNRVSIAMINSRSGDLSAMQVRELEGLFEDSENFIPPSKAPSKLPDVFQQEFVREQILSDDMMEKAQRILTDPQMQVLRTVKARQRDEIALARYTEELAMKTARQEFQEQ